MVLAEYTWDNLPNANLLYSEFPSVMCYLEIFYPVMSDEIMTKAIMLLVNDRLFDSNKYIEILGNTFKNSQKYLHSFDDNLNNITETLLFGTTPDDPAFSRIHCVSGNDSVEKLESDDDTLIILKISGEKGSRKF